MRTPVKAALNSLGLALLVLLPFAVRLLLSPVEEERRREGGAAPIRALISRGDYRQAYHLLQKIDPDALEPRQQEERAFQQAFCELALELPAPAYAHLHALEGARPLLEPYRLFWMGRALEDMDEPRAAMAAYEDFLLGSTHPTLRDSVYLRLAGLYEEGGNRRQALEIYRRHLAQSPEGAPEVLYRMARVYEALADAAAARKKRLQLVREYPEHPRALQALLELKKPQSAQEAYPRALAYFRHQRYAQAAAALRRFLRAYPGDPLAAKAHYLLGRTYLAQRQYDRAQKTFERVYSLYHTPAALYRTGGILVRRNRDAEAIERYEKFVRLYPRHELADDALWRAAKAAERHDDFERAEGLYRRVAGEYAGGEYADEAYWNIGFTYYCRRQYGEALKIFRQLSRRAPEAHMVDQSLFWAGKAAARLQRPEESRGYYEEAARGFPRSYYASRALSLGYGRPPPPAPPQRREAAAAKIEGAEFVGRAEALQRLGLRLLARGELQQAERLNAKNISALKALRARCETLGFVDRALRLSVRISIADSAGAELRHLYPSYYQDQVAAAAREAGIDPELILSVIRQESFFKENAVSRAGAMGLMQIMPQTGRLLAREAGLGRFSSRQLFNPEISIRLGARFLGAQVRTFGRESAEELGFELGLAAYNAGPEVAHQWLERFAGADADAFVERIPYRETRLYIKKVLKNYTIYKAL